MSDAAGSMNSVPAGNALDLVARAARDGAADASRAAARFWSDSGQVLARVAYSTTYTISYGVVFPIAYIARAIPANNAAVRGLVDGAQDATRKAEAILGR